TVRKPCRFSTQCPTRWKAPESRLWADIKMGWDDTFAGRGRKARRAPMPRGAPGKTCLLHGFENVAALADDLWLRHFDKRHADPGAKQLQGDFLAVAEFDSIAIGAVFEPREHHALFVPDAEARL